VNARIRRGAPPALAVCAMLLSGGACISRSSLPEALGDQEFWSLTETLSEPPGVFSLSDNLVSNEPALAENARWVRPRGGVYIGVGPEQNFTYIASARPAMAFIIDIRRENLSLHLFYKALFELSIDRADFLSRLFARPRPDGVGIDTSVDDLFDRYEKVKASPDLLGRNLALVRDWLLTTRRLPLAPGDLEWIDRVATAFFTDGPSIHFGGPQAANAVQPSYRRLMTLPDGAGERRSFLATEEGFRFVQRMHTRNLIVPVVGDFGGTDAIRRVGDYTRRHGAAVMAFYGSNVGVYLNERQARAYCTNLAGLPADPRTSFIERDGVRLLAAKVRDCRADAK
jgi:hypothetical protein